MADPSVPAHHCACATCQATPDSPAAAYHRQINVLLSRLTEPQRRWYVASLAADPNGPSAAQLTLITGLSLPTIRRGAAELATGLPDTPPTRQRAPGAGGPAPKKRSGPDPDAAPVGCPHTAGDPQSEAKWLNCRLRV